MADQVITGGVFAYEAGVKSPIEYEPPRKARAELRFDVPEGHAAEDVISLVRDMAVSQVALMLGTTPAAVGGTIGIVTSTGEAPAAPATPEPKRTRRTTAQIAADKAAEAAASSPAADPASFGADPQATTSAGAASSPTTNVPAGGAQPPQPTADDWDIPATPVAEITDAELVAAVQKRNGELGPSEAGTNAIRALIASYNPDPTKQFQIRNITADKRAEFLEKLKVANIA